MSTTTPITHFSRLRLLSSATEVPPPPTHWFVGIHREPAHLLNNAGGTDNADQAVISRVGDYLRAHGYPVKFFKKTRRALDFCAEQRSRSDAPHITLFNMCRDDENLRLLDAFSQEHARVSVVNSPQSARLMLRKPLYLQMQALGVPLPPTEILSLSQARERSEHLCFPVWLKLTDHHHIQGFGVQRALNPDDFLTQLDRFAAHLSGSAPTSAARTRRSPDLADPARACTDPEVIVQQDIGGGVETKFYGVYSRASDSLIFFVCNQPLPRPLLRRLRNHSLQLARRLDVQVFGGDCIIKHNKPFVIDFNSWPSFRACVDDGARSIATCLLSDLGLPTPAITPFAVPSPKLPSKRIIRLVDRG